MVWLDTIFFLFFVNESLACRIKKDYRKLMVVLSALPAVNSSKNLTCQALARSQNCPAF
jgi:hypothetical protein